MAGTGGYTLPTVDRFQPVETPSVGRVDVRAPDVSGAQNLQNKSIQDLADKGLSAMEHYELQVRDQELNAMDVKASSLANGYETLYKSRLAEINQMKGDTSEAYAELQKQKQEWSSQLTENTKGSPPELQMLLGHKVSLTNARMYQDETVQQSTQNFKYRQSVNEETVKLRQDSMMNYGTMLNVNNPESFMGFKAQVDSIVDTNSKNAAANGLAKKDVNGEIVELSPAAINKIKEDVGGGIVNVVKVLNNSGRVKEAKKLMDDYGDYINAKDKEKLLADNGDANVKNLALDAVSRLKNPSGKAAIDEINNNKELSEAVKYKMKEIVDTNDRRGEYANKRKADDTYQKSYELLNSKQKTKTPFLTTSEMWEDPYMKAAKQNMTPQQIKSMEEQVVAPKESDMKAKIAIQQDWQGGRFAKMKPQELNMRLQGLSKEDRDKYTGLWNSVQKKTTKVPGVMTESARRERMNFMNKSLLDDAQLAGAVPKTGAPETWNEKDKAYYSKMVDGFADYYSKNVGDNLKDPISQKSAVRDYLRSYMSNNPQPEKSWWQFGGRKAVIPPALGARSGISDPETDTMGPRPPREKPLSKGVDINNMDAATLKNWRNEYLKANPQVSSIPDTATFQNWINKQAGKK